MGAGQGSSKRALWREVISEQSVSGMSVREYCAAYGIGEASFYNWRRRLRDEAGQFRGAGKAEMHKGRFVALEIVDPIPAAAMMEIRLSQGLSIHLREDVDPEILSGVLSACRLSEPGTRNGEARSC